VRCIISFVHKIGNSRLKDFSLFPLAVKFYFHTETRRKKRFTEFAFLFFLRVCSVRSVSPCENESEIFAFRGDGNLNIFRLSLLYDPLFDVNKYKFSIFNIKK